MRTFAICNFYILVNHTNVQGETKRDLFTDPDNLRTLH